MQCNFTTPAIAPSSDVNSLPSPLLPCSPAQCVLCPTETSLLIPSNVLAYAGIPCATGGVHRGRNRAPNERLTARTEKLRSQETAEATCLSARTVIGRWGFEKDPTVVGPSDCSRAWDWNRRPTKNASGLGLPGRIAALLARKTSFSGRNLALAVCPPNYRA